jgi:hypothetical protein
LTADGIGDEADRAGDPGPTIRNAMSESSEFEGMAWLMEQWERLGSGLTLLDVLAALDSERIALPPSAKRALHAGGADATRFGRIKPLDSADR